MALNLDDYTRTQWEPKMPITESRMNKLEEGVYVNREALQELDTSVSANTTAIDRAATKQELQDLSTSVSSAIAQNSASGQRAMTELRKVIVINPSTQETTYGLDNMKADLESAISVLSQTFGTKTETVDNTSEVRTVPAYNSTNTVYKAIEDLISAIGRDSQGNLVYSYNSNPVYNNTVFKNISALQSDFNNARGTSESLAQRLENMTLETIRIKDKAEFAQTQIQNAMRTDLVDENQQPIEDSLSKRFADIVSALAENTSSISSLTGNVNDNYVKKADVRNDFVSSDTNLPLSALKGKELRDMIGGNYDSANTVTGAINNAANTAETNAKNYADTNKVDKANIYNALDYVPAQDATDDKVLDARQGKALKDTIDALNTSLDARLDAIELELNNARIELGTDEESGDPLMSTLDQRLDAMDATAAALRNEVQVIANELAMYDDNDAIQDTWTRVDKLSRDVEALAAELSMARNENGELIDTASRIDNLEYTISHVSSDEDSTVGLTQRIATLESDVDAAENNISDLDTRLDAIDGGEALTDAKTLATRVSEAESAITTLQNEPKSATEVISVEDFEALTENEANSHKDYLVGPDENNLYKYYHIIETSDNVYEKVLISGGTTGGTSSAQFAATTEEITNPNINTDYYVGNNNDGYLHYRYIEESGSSTLKPVIIGLHDYYQIDTHEVSEDNDTVTYLDLYKFNEARTQASLDYDIDKNNIIGTIKLPKGGGAVSNERIYVKIPAGQSQYISYKDLQDNGLSLGFSYTCYSVTNGDYEYESAVYTLATESGEIIKQSGNPISPLTREAYNANTINISFNREDNLAQYCTKNNMTKFILTLSVPDREDIIPRTLTVMITPVELSLTSTFSDQRTYTNTDDLIIPYTFTGISGENINFEILFGDGNTEENITASSVINSQASRITIRNSILANKVGVYNLRIRASQLISGTQLYSNTLAYQIGLIELNYDNILLFSGASIEEQVTEQYYTLDLPYYLYLPSNIESAIVSYDVKQVIYDDQKVIVREDSVPALIRPADTLSTGAQKYSLRISNMIAETEYYKVIITCEDASLVFNVRVNIASQQINIETQGLMFDFKPEQFSNNASTLEEKLWSYESNGIKYSMRIPDNAHFDWRTGGWIEDDNHVPCFCIKAGSRVEFIQQNINQNNISPLTLFWNGMESTGSDFKCVFKIDNVKTPDAPFLTSLDTVENTIINYGKLILSDKQDIEDDSTLLYSYLNTRYLYTKTINSKGKVVKESIGTTVLNDGVNEVYGRFGSQLTEAKRAAAETKAAKKNTDKIKNYINNIYTIANYARILEHKEALLNILSGNSIGTAIDYTTIQDNILSYLQNVTNATAVYNTLTTLENDTSSVIYAYRQEEPENLDAILNGFVVEGKEGKDGIIAMLEFTFETIIKNGGTFTSQTVSTEEGWPRTNTFTSTATFLVMVEDKKYEVTMKDENGTYTEIISIQDASNETQTAYGLELNALGSNIYLPSGRVSYAHSEGDTIEFEYNINAPLDQKINSSIIIYEDGVPSAAKLYTTGNGILEQQAPGKLTIGSDDCDVYIYKMRLYDRALTDKQILNNFYADGLTVDDMIARYNRNKNLITNSIDELTPQLVAQECPDLRVIMIEAPNLTGGKTSFIKNTKIRCIYKNGRPEDNWVALNAYHAGQGTSSDNYGASARNLDIIFGFDGKDTVIVPKPQKNNYQFDPNYKSILIKGLDKDTTNDIKEAQEYEEEGYSVYYNTGENEPGTVSLTKDSVPNNWFNIKVNVASSENTNNAFLQKRFNRYLQQHVYKTPAQKRDYRIKNDMEFFNCAIFIKETGTPKEFLNDNGEERHWHFYGLGNIGDSKKTDKTRVNVPSDPYEFAVEITDNGLLLSGFSSGVFYISEASKLRSQTNNADIAAASSMTKSHVCSSGEYTANNGTYTFSISSPNAETMYFVPENNDTYYHRFIYLNNTWTEVGEPISFARTSYGIKYPVSKAEWECSLNTYHEALYNFGGKGWDKSFEFRYDITTKDGETVARSDLEEALNELHQSANKKAFADMYSYIVTVPNANFVNQLNNWFIENSLPYWYLFTERYTMIDSRAKNTFYHYGKIYITEDEASGAAITALNEIKNSHLSEYIADNHIQAYNTATAEQIANAELDYQISTATFLHENAEYFEIDNAKAAINNGYRFELWGYDMDTALGINNNGQMVFSAGVEDTDKDASGWIYNEAESVIWRRVRENMYTQLAALYINLKADCFNAENLINEFDQLQAQFPEELWRADFERKYYRPFRDLNETTYLNDMANGRKKYQRRQFERNMAIYINSKYQRNGSYLENDLISFRPQFTWTEGRDTRIIIKPYSTMYINFALGNYDNTTDNVSGAQSIFKRVERGEEFVINTSDYIHDYNNIQCIIYNASRLMYLDGLGNFECKQFILGAAKKLSVLKLGSSVYTNRSMTDITNLGLSTGLPLLEELDLTNIEFGTSTNNTWVSNPPQTFALENFPLLKKLNAEGCNIRSFTFKDGGMLEHIIFPSILTKIEFKNLYKLVDTYENETLIPAVVLTGAANLIDYYSTNSYSSSYNIVQNMINNSMNRITQLYLDDINWTINNLTDLGPLVTLQKRLKDKMYLKGTITVTGSWSKVKIDAYEEVWENRLHFNTDANKEVIEYKLSFYLNSEDALNETNVYYTSYLPVEEGMTDAQLGDDPVYIGLCETPAKASTISKEYYFGTNPTTYYSWSGWRIVDNVSAPRADMTINSNTVFVAVFGEKTRTYPLRWYLNETDNEDDYVKQVLGLEYNSSYENGLAPTALDMIQANRTLSSLNGTDYTYKIFKGWAREPINLDSTYFNASQTAFCIYGSWEQGTESLATIRAQEELDEKKLLVLTNTNDKILPTSSTYTVEMGYDNNSGTTIIGKNAMLGISPRGEAYTGEDVNHPVLKFTQYNGALAPTIRPVNDIKPFAKMNTDGFTLAIDYQLDTDYLKSIYSNGYCILGGCYAANSGNNTAQGFAIYYDINAGVVKACFGNLANTNTYSSSDYSCAISNNYGSSKRNIVVIRHMKGTNTLQFYSGIHGQQGMLLNLNNDNFRQTLTWSNNNITSPLCFGHFTNGTFTALASVHPGVGTTIHWAKYWETDLGHNECTLLAAWPHEKITFALSDYSNDGTNDILVTNSRNMIFSALQLSEYGGAYYDAINIVTNNTVNWGTGLTTNTNSAYKKISNQRFFLGLPIKLQSIITRTVGNAATITAATTGYYSVYQYTTSGETIDLAFIPTYTEVGGTDINYQSEALRAFPWYTGSNAQVFSYGTNNFLFDDVSYSAEYMNLRFSSVPIKTTSGINNVFVGYSGTDPIYNKINISSNPNGGIRRGDIFVYTYISNNNTITNTYIYADGLDVAQGAPIVNAAEGELLYCDVGGWIKAGSWWTRTPAATYENKATGTQPFFYIDGNTSSIRYNSTPAEGGAYFVYEFGI